MSTIAPTQPAPPIPLKPYRLTVHEFERIADSLDDEHAELMDGQIIGSIEMKPPHALAVTLLPPFLTPIIPGGWHLRADIPIRIPMHDELRPDFTIARGNPRDYANNHPGPRDVAVVIEISDASLGRDRNQKYETYGKSGIAIYWIINLLDRQIEVYSGPSANGYTSRTDYLIGDRVPVIIDGSNVGTIAVIDLLP